MMECLLQSDQYLITAIDPAVQAHYTVRRVSLCVCVCVCARVCKCVRVGSCDSSSSCRGVCSDFFLNFLVLINIVLLLFYPTSILSITVIIDVFFVGLFLYYRDSYKLDENDKDKTSYKS